MTWVGACFSLSLDQVGSMTLPEAVAYLEAHSEMLGGSGGSSLPDKRVARMMHAKAKARGYRV